MPISDCDVRDPRMRRTRELLKRALQTLLQNKKLDEILVQDITDLATVNRATFYDHYADKFALFEAMVAGGFHQLLRERNIHFDGTCPSGLIAIILAVSDYLVQADTGPSPLTVSGASAPLLDAAVTKAIRRVLLEGASQNAGSSTLPTEIIAGTLSGALYAAVKEWLQLPNRPPAEQIAPSLVQLLLPLLHPEPARSLAPQS